MGKAAMCIQMLQILNSGRVYKISELASLLETNPRNIIEYKNELEEAGYYIVSIPGRFGGYRLENTSIIPSLTFTEEESHALQVATSYLQDRGDFLDTKIYQKAMAKVFSSSSKTSNSESTVIIQDFIASMSNDEIMDRYKAIESCIKTKTIIEIKFLSTDNVVRKRKFEPYKLFIFHNAWFAIGYCQLAQDIRYFKLNRIESYQKTNEHFRKNLYYKESDYFDKHGFKKGLDWLTGEYVANQKEHIKLLFHGIPAMYVKQYVYGDNQQITSIDKDNTILECDMMYKYEVVKFTLSFGTDCEVLEPLWLKDEVKRIAKEMSKDGFDGKI